MKDRGIILKISEIVAQQARKETKANKKVIEARENISSFEWLGKTV
jgi:hypothetical protein